MDLLILLVTVPAITAFIGFITNWAAVKMIFHPQDFIGVGPIGWQGVLYRMGDSLAAEVAATTSKVLSPAEILERLAPHELAARITTELGSDLEAVVAEIVEQLQPGTWELATPEARAQTLALVAAETSAAVDEIMVSLAEHAEEVVDLDGLVVDMFTGEHNGRLARVAQEVCAQELRFVELYGGAFGFMVGLIQALSYSMFQDWRLMPLVGGIVGLATNWLAIQMIFRPVEPRRYFGLLTYQGMFPKRQAAIAADYGRIISQEVLTPANLLDRVMTGPGAPRAAAIIREAFTARLDGFAAMIGTASGNASTDAIITSLENRIAPLAPKALPIIEAHITEHLELDTLIRNRLSEMPPKEFERLIRGIFEENEYILVLVGGALGAAVGALQGAVMLALKL